ncbi:M23 family metallopeptidase [Streptomyces sp. NPDC086023]|uniref:M23 family metallopeptidase n=1 Tax=Streptomyces sp. NPDC086023 TaxID=3365746 RepID=UPI0037D19CEF
MSKSAATHRVRQSAFRTRSTVVAAGLGALMVFGAGHAAFAAGTTDVSTALSAPAQLVSEQAAAAKKAAGWTNPVENYVVSATYGKGGSMWARKHSGQDFAVPTGTPVKAVHKGVVVKAGPNGAGDGPAYGNAIVIKHANNTYSQYAHLSKVQVRVGQTVSTDQRIGLSGNTGNSSGPHLHFEIRTTPNYGSAINPVTFLAKAGVKI